jgi:hypothetical protein
MDAYVYRTMPLNVPCAASLWAGNLGCSVDRIVVVNVNDVDPQAWLADILSRIAMYPAHRLSDMSTRLPVSPKCSANTRIGCGTLPTKWIRRTD